MNYAKHYETLIDKHGSKAKPDTYSELHHILPKCLGGGEEESNLVYLSAEAHYVAHQLLVKINPEHYGVSYAAMLMTRIGRGKGNGRACNKYYAWLKKRFSKLQSMIMKEWLKENGNPSTRADVKKLRSAAWSGENNPCYGKPNWKAIEAASKVTKGKKLKPEHATKVSSSIAKWHRDNPERHPMKDPQILAKAVASRRATYERKKEQGLLNPIRAICVECGMESTIGNIIKHQKSKNHHGIERKNRE